MKLKFLVSLLLAVLLTLPIMASSPPSKSVKHNGNKSAALDTDTWIDVNKILMIVANDGAFATDLGGTLGKTDGLYYPFTSVDDILSGTNDKTVIYASGLWIGAQDSIAGDTLICLAEYSEEYVTGPMNQFVSVSGNDTTWTFDPQENQNTDYRVYKLYADSLENNPNDDYLNWPVDQGAPVDSAGKPKMIGDQMLWTVYNDADATAHTNNSGKTAPLGLEIRESVFGFKREDPLGNMVFIRFRIFNKGGKHLNNMYISLWADPDLGDAGDDLDGSDTTLSMGYCYNGTNNDGVYGSKPPAVGYDFFQGPLMYTGDDTDTAKMWDTVFVGYKNMPMTSFNKYINGTDPQNKVETYNYMQGLQADGTPLANGTKFFSPGNPVTGVGDLDFDPADRRYMLTTGPISFDPGDSTEVIAAIVVGQGGDRLSSISVMKFYDKFAQLAYDNNFNVLKPPAPPVVSVHQLKGEMSLEWTDTSEVTHGDYPFEGYTVYQGESAGGPWKRIANFDIVDGVAIILDEVLDPETGVLETRAVKYGSDNGIQRFYGTDKDFINGGSLNDITQYYYKVEAYSYISDPNATPKTLTSATVVEATPQAPLAGTETDFVFGDTLSVNHISGISDGAVVPYIIDPLALTGDDYMVVFETDSTLGPVWSLIDVTTGTTILNKQTNQTGDENYKIVNGMLIKVTGPAVAGMKDWDIPNGTRRFTWANADGFGWEGFGGAIGWGGPGDTHGFGGNPPIPPSKHVSVLLKLATVDTLNGSDTLGSFTFDPNDPNVSYAYRYGRGFTNPPAQPEFAPFMINTVDGGYRFQDFEKSVPLSAWNVDVDPPQRLAVGFLENNAANGRVDGKWFPGSYTNYDNIAGDGPREWLWIYLDDYSETPNSAYEGEAISDPMPVLWWLTVNRRGVVPFSPDSSGEDQFLIISNHINTAVDTFTFKAVAPKVATTGNKYLDDIKVVPNPYYLFSSYDNSNFNRQIRFTHLPKECTIKIFNLAGDLIRTLKKNSDESWMYWDIETSNGIPVASGIYVYVVEAPGFGQKIGKMAVFVEEEQLDTY